MRKLLFQSFFRAPLTEPAPVAGPGRRRRTRSRCSQRAARRRLGRSLSIREIDAGSCNGCELEIHALNNAYYDVERFGIRFVASPRHADVLLVTGPVTKNMREALKRTHDATPGSEVGGCIGRLRPRRRLLLPAATQWSAASRRSFPSTFTSPAVRRHRRRSCRHCCRCLIGRRKVPDPAAALRRASQSRLRPHFRKHLEQISIRIAEEQRAMSKGLVCGR